VSLVIPIRNERAHIDRCLRSVTVQSYPRHLLEIIVVDGDSTDGTRDLLQAWVSRDDRIRLLDNSRRGMVPGLNIGIAASSGVYVGCVSGHSELPAEYVARCVALLERHGAWGVGAGIERRSLTPTQRAIGRAQSHPFGVGGAVHNYGVRSGWAEAIFPGFWPRWVFERVGDFDERMAFNEDNELSHRITRAGGRLWYEPSVRVGYFPRSSLRALARQYWGYGGGKAALFATHPGAVRPRHLAPGALIAALAVGAVLSLPFPAARLATVMLGVTYVGVATAAAAVTRRQGDSVMLVSAAFVTMHIAYGAGLWWGLGAALVRMVSRRARRSRPSS
jgi:succinoglycan biosynthesis protein ExoA